MSQIISFLDEIGALILSEAPGSKLQRHFGAEYGRIKRLAEEQERDLRAALAGLVKLHKDPSEKHCVYTVDTEYGSTSCSACDMELVFEEGSAEDSGYKFCPGCGYAIAEFKVKQEPEPEDEL